MNLRNPESCRLENSMRESKVVRTVTGVSLKSALKCLLVILVVSALLTPAFLFGKIYLSKVWGFQSRTALMLGCEMMCETGPNFKAAANQHQVLLGEYSRYVPSPFLMRMMPAKYELQKDLEVRSAYLSETLDSNDLTQEEAQEEAARAIWQAGEEIVRFRMRTAGISASEEQLSKTEMPTWLKEKIETAIVDCNNTLLRLKHDNSPKTALELCEADRRAMLLIFLARSDSNISDYLKEFRAIVEKTIETKGNLAQSVDNNDESELLRIFVRSEQRRLQIVDAMLEPDNMSKAYSLMWKTISQTAAERPKKLLLASKLNYGENLSARRISH